MRVFRRVIGSLIILLVPVVLYLCLWPVEIDPGPGSAPAAPALSGTYAPNTYLDQAQRLVPGFGVGPEDVAMDSQGRLYTGYQDGRIIRMRPDGTAPEVFANTGGRPLGLAWDAAHNLIVADANKGVLSIDPQGAITTLTTEEGGRPFGFTDDVDVAADGMIYFTDASWKFHAPNYLADLMEHRGNGRFLSYDPKTKLTAKLIGNLYFANGVTLSPDQSYALINETWEYRVLRYWLTGDKKDSWDVFIKNLPGFPDNISTGPRGNFWLALANPRNAQADAMLPYPFVRGVMWRLPKALLPPAQRYGFVLGLDGTGKVMYNLQSPSGKFAPITSVNEFEGALYLGSIGEDAVAKVPAPQH